MTKKRLSKTQRNRREQEQNYIVNTKFSMKQIQPMTDNQHKMFNSYEDGKNILAIGSPGTGKTYISLYLAFKDVMSHNEYREVIVVRSAVQSREQGHLKGGEAEKMASFEQPYIDATVDLFERGDAYQILKQKGMLKFLSTSFNRGLSLNNSIIIVDECQNMNYGELKTIFTRIGQNTKILFCGDTRQDDLTGSKNKSDVSGLKLFIKVLEHMNGNYFETIEFTSDDIVRSDIVKQFIIAEEQLGIAA